MIIRIRAQGGRRPLTAPPPALPPCLLPFTHILSPPSYPHCLPDLNYALSYFHLPLTSSVSLHNYVLPSFTFPLACHPVAMSSTFSCLSLYPCRPLLYPCCPVFLVFQLVTLPPCNIFSPPFPPTSPSTVSGLSGAAALTNTYSHTHAGVSGAVAA